MGATLAYQGHLVSLEWQSRQARLRMSWTGCGGFMTAEKVREESVGGLDLAGAGKNWMRRARAAPPRKRFFFMRSKGKGQAGWPALLVYGSGAV
jgi:hypothetical protein